MNIMGPTLMGLESLNKDGKLIGGCIHYIELPQGPMIPVSNVFTNTYSNSTFTINVWEREVLWLFSFLIEWSVSAWSTYVNSKSGSSVVLFQGDLLPYLEFNQFVSINRF